MSYAESRTELYRMTIGSPPRAPDNRAWQRAWSSQAVLDGKPSTATMWFLPIHPLWMWD